MADIGPRIGIDGEKQFRQELTNINQKLKTMASEAKALVSALTSADDAEERLYTTKKALSEQIDLQKKKIEKLNEGYKKAEEALGEDDAATQKWKQAVYDATTTLHNMESELDNTENELKDMSHGMGDAEQQAGDLASKLNTAGNEVDDMSHSMKDAEQQTGNWADVLKGTLLSAAIVGGVKLLGNAIKDTARELKDFVKSSVTTGMGFDAAMSQVAATMGTTVDQIEDLRDTAKRMGAETKYTATEAAEGLNILAQSGLDAKEQISSIGTVLDLASAGALSLESAASYVTATVKGFSDSMDNAGYYADLMAKGATLANTSVAGLGEAMGAGAATAANYGQSAEGMTLALLRLAEQNVIGAEAATALNRAMMDLYTPTDKAKLALDALGISAYDASGNARDFNTIVDELSAALADMSQEEQNAYKDTVFTTYGLQAFNKMTVASTKTVQKFSKGLKQSAGSAAKQAATQIDNLSGDVTIFQSALDGARVRLSDGLTPALREATKTGTKLLSNPTIQRALDKISKKVGDLIARLANTAGDVLPKLIKNSDKVGTTIKKVAAIAGGLLVTVKGFSIVQSITSTIKTATSAVTGLNAAMAANPVGAVISAVGILISVLASLGLAANDSAKHMNALSEEEQEMVDAAHDAAESYKDLKKSYETSVGLIMDETKATQGLWAELQTLADENGNVKKSDQERAEFILGKLNEALGTEYDMNDGIIGQYTEMREQIENLIKARQAEALLEANKSAYQTALENEAGAIDALNVKYNQLQRQKNAVSIATNRLMRFEMSHADEIRGVDGSLADLYLQNGALALQWEELQESVRDATRQYAAMEKEYDSLSDETAQYYADVQRYRDADAAIAQGHYDDAIKLLTDETAYRWKNLDASKKISKQELAQLKADVDKKVFYAKWYKQQYEAGVSGFTKAELKEAEDAAKELQRIFEQQSKEAEQAGKNLAEGIKKGLKSREQELYSTASSIMSGTLKVMKNTAQIASPSKVTTQYGKFVAMGLPKGLEAESKNAVKSAKSLVSDVLGAMSELKSPLQWSGGYTAAIKEALRNAAAPARTPIYAGAGSTSYETNFGGITVYVNAANVDNVNDLAGLVAEKLNKQLINAQRARA